jgi:hypothetical protein
LRCPAEYVGHEHVPGVIPNFQLSNRRIGNGKMQIIDVRSGSSIAARSGRAFDRGGESPGAVGLDRRRYVGESREAARRAARADLRLGGAGAVPRGCGLRKDIRFLVERGSVSNPGADGEQDLHPKAIYPLAHGDLVSVRVSGSGGYGDPRARDPESVARDVALGYVSLERAREGYGVAIDPASGAVDAVATARLRDPDRSPA